MSGFDELLGLAEGVAPECNLTKQLTPKTVEKVGDAIAIIESKFGSHTPLVFLMYSDSDIMKQVGCSSNVLKEVKNVYGFDKKDSKYFYERVWFAVHGCRPIENMWECMPAYPFTEDVTKGIAEAINLLSDENREIIEKRFKDCMTLNELAEYKGFSRNKVDLDERKALKSLRTGDKRNFMLYGYKVGSTKRQIKEDARKAAREKLMIDIHELGLESRVENHLHICNVINICDLVKMIETGYIWALYHTSDSTINDIIGKVEAYDIDVKSPFKCKEDYLNSEAHKRLEEFANSNQFYRHGIRGGFDYKILKYLEEEEV